MKDRDETMAYTIIFFLGLSVCLGAVSCEMHKNHLENKVEMLRINKISDKVNCVFGAENADHFKRKWVGK